jgi:hypothetical protein
VASLSGGTVSRIDPLELQKSFSAVMLNPVIATQVSCTFMLHRGMHFRNEDVDTSRVVRDLGSVTADMEVTFEYGLRLSELQRFKDLQSLPFQVQINFTKPNGMKVPPVHARVSIVCGAHATPRTVSPRHLADPARHARQGAGWPARQDAPAGCERGPAGRADGRGG